MRSKTLAIGAALCMGLVAAKAQSLTMSVAPLAPATELRPLTLDEALRQASVASPILRAKQAQLAAVQGAQADAAAFFRLNPELSASGTRREVPQTAAGSDRYREWNAGFSQPIEIAGQRGYRREATAAAAAALNAEIADAERQAHGKRDVAGHDGVHGRADHRSQHRPGDPDGRRLALDPDCDCRIRRHHDGLVLSAAS